MGYLPEKDSEVAANLMDAGKSFYAVVTAYVLFLKKLRNSYRIDIAVYTED